MIMATRKIVIFTKTYLIIRGVNNAFLIRKRNYLAILYNGNEFIEAISKNKIRVF